MRLVISMFEEEFIKAIKHDDVKEVVEFYLGQEFEKVMTINDFLKIVNFEGFADIYDSIEFDVENDLGRLLNKYGILQGISFGAVLIQIVIDLLLVIVGFVLIKKYSKKEMNFYML